MADIKVNIQMEEGDVLGATPSEHLVITRIQPGTLAEGKLQEGDKILKVNNSEPTDSHHFYRLINAAARKGHVELLIRRDKKTQDVIKDSLTQVPKERMANLRIRDGCHYKVVNMEFQKGDKIGLGIKDYMNCVIVTKAPEGTSAGRVLKVGDQICDVDGQRVTDKGVAQNLIVTALKAKQSVSMVIATAETEEAKKWVGESLLSGPVSPGPPSVSASPAAKAAAESAAASKALSIVSRDPPSIRVKADVRRIAFQEIERRKATKAELLKSIKSIVRPPNSPAGKRVSFNSKLTDEHLIVNENPNAPLRPVK